MRVLELFSGTGILSETARALGHETFTVDLSTEADLRADILSLEAPALLALTGWDSVDMVWASPPCNGFSIASVGKMWNNESGVYTPKHRTAELGFKLLRHTLHLIETLNPRAWFIENPRGMMRKMPEMVALEDQRQTVTFCQYGETRMKPTDIWSSRGAGWTARPVCKNGDPCHVAAPRGSRTGTQGLPNAALRAKLPYELCVEVLNAANKGVRHGD